MENQKEQKGAALTRISELQRRRRLRKIRNGCVIGLIVVVLVLSFTGSWQKIYTFADDLIDQARIAMMPGEGWPAKTGISEILQMEPLADGFAELGKQDLVMYSDNGNKLRSIQHGYARPAVSVGGDRLCLYNRSGNELRIESRTRTLQVKEFEEPILLAQMSGNGNLAVVTGAKRGLAELTILDLAMKEIYGWTLVEENGLPSQIAFANDNRRLAVACLKAENGTFASSVYLLDTRKDKITAEVKATGSPILQMRWLNDKKLLVVYTDRAVVYNQNGEEQAKFDYGGKPLTDTVGFGSNTVMLFNQPQVDAPARLVVLDADLQCMTDIQVPSPVQGLACSRTHIYVIRKNSVAAYTMAGKLLWETELEAPPLAVLGSKPPLVFSGGEVDVLKKTEQK